MSAGPEILRHAAIYRPGCFAWNRENDAPVLFHPLFHKLPFCPKSFLPLVRQRRVIPPGTQTAYSKGYISSLVGHSVVKVHGLDRRQSAQTRRGRYACAAWRLVEMCLNLSNAIKLTRSYQKESCKAGRGVNARGHTQEKCGCRQPRVWDSCGLGGRAGDYAPRSGSRQRAPPEGHGSRSRPRRRN